jgi:hypothetical protein
LNHFLICASGEEYSIYLINGKGDILSKQIETNNKPVLGRDVAFFTLGDNQFLYQQDFSNNFLSYNTKNKKFTNINLLCNKDDILSIEEVKKHQKKFNKSKYLENNPSVKVIGGFSSSADHLLFVVGNQSIGFKCYFMNTSNNTIDYRLMENTVDDISFTHTFSLLNNISKSDSEGTFITYLYPYQIIDGLKENIKLNKHPNYQRLQSLFSNIQDFNNENPVLIELKR